MLNYLYITFVLSITIHLSSSQDFQEEYVEAVQNGMLNFGVKLNNIIESNNPSYKNIVFSPTSVYAALALLHYGSDGVTRDELSSALGIPRPYSLFKIHETIQGILQELHKCRPRRSLLADQTMGKANVTRFHFAEAIFAQNGLKIERSYIANTKPLYGNDFINVDFGRNDNAAADINTYIEKHTQKRASDLYTLLAPPPSHNRFILESCSYFNAIFETRFIKKKTKYGLFYMDNGHTS